MSVLHGNSMETVDITYTFTVQIFEPDDNTYAKEAEHCSMCEGALTKRVLFVCESGHVVCEACRTPDGSCHKLENGKALQNNLQTLKPVCREITEVSHNDLASGDHRSNNKHALKSKSKSICHVECDKRLRSKIQTFSEEIIPADHKETTIKYKNDNFCDSDSSISSQIVHKQHNHINESQRPVSCPVTECGKVIARDSVLQHFYFDHSKVPRVEINQSECHEVFIELTSISERVTCHVVLLIKTDTLSHADSRTLMNGGYKNSSFLLMSARMPGAEMIKTRGSDSVPKRHVQTQTDAVKIRCSKVHMKSQSSIKSEDSLTKAYCNNDGDIMLWICKLGDSNYYYKISVTTADMKSGSSITGASVNIRDSHDSNVIWDQFDHLHIREKYINKLTNKQNQLRITINIFQ